MQDCTPARCYGQPKISLSALLGQRRSYHATLHRITEHLAHQTAYASSSISHLGIFIFYYDFRLFSHQFTSFSAFLKEIVKSKMADLMSSCDVIFCYNRKIVSCRASSRLSTKRKILLMCVIRTKTHRGQTTPLSLCTTYALGPSKFKKKRKKCLSIYLTSRESPTERN